MSEYTIHNVNQKDRDILLLYNKKFYNVGYLIQDGNIILFYSNDLKHIIEEIRELIRTIIKPYIER